FDGQEQIIVVNERAQFTTEELSLENGSWENYSDLDFLNRVGVAEAMLGQDLMPTSEREDISSVKPTGWKNKKIVFNGKEDYLYNRSHLIG
ncbi:DNA/RNA non-specific endonuclease, partial [Streptococcus suis]